MNFSQLSKITRTPEQIEESRIFSENAKAVFSMNSAWNADRCGMPTARPYVILVAETNLKIVVAVGNSFEIKDALKAAGAKFNGIQKRWEFSFDTIADAVAKAESLNIQLGDGMTREERAEIIEKSK